MSEKHAKPRCFTAMGVFLAFAGAMATLAGTTLVHPGTPLDRLWALNPRAFAELAPLRPWIGVPFLLLAAAMAWVAWAWFTRSLWGWRMAVILMAMQLLGGFGHLIAGRIAQGVVGVVIPAAILVYLLNRRVRSAFPQ